MSCVAVSAAILVGACASEPHPWKRPLSLDHATAMADTNVALIENNDGVETSWFMSDSSATGAQYGLIGALVSATMDGIVNAGPSDQAQKTADQIAVVAAVDRMNQSLNAQVKAAVAADGYKIRFSDVSTLQKLTTPKTPDDTVEVNVSYTLSEDASAMKMIAVATYENANVKYVTPYTFKSVPEDETSGPLYRNTFIYESARLPLPVLTPELKASWEAEIRQTYLQRTGKVPTTQKDKGYREYNDELSEARNDVLTKAESSRVLAKAWTDNNGAFLFNELQTGHAFLAKYLLLDLNAHAVPKLDGTDDVVEQVADGRVVRLVGAGTGAGSYISSPGGLSIATTYGNAVQVAKVNRDRASAIAEAAKKKK